MAAGHPPIGFTQYIVKHVLPNPAEPERQIPVGIVKELRVDLPAGLTVNPQATPQCPLEVFEAPTFVDAECEDSIVGKEELTLATVVELNPNPFPFIPLTSLPSGFQIPPNPFLNTEPPLFNLEPKQGEPALFGFKIGPAKSLVLLRTDVAWEGDYHAGFFITPPPSSSPALRSLKSRLVNIGTTRPEGVYITNPTTCFNPLEPASRTPTRPSCAPGRRRPDAELPSGLHPVRDGDPRMGRAGRLRERALRSEHSRSRQERNRSIRLPDRRSMTKLPFEPEPGPGLDEQNGRT